MMNAVAIGTERGFIAKRIGFRDRIASIPRDRGRKTSLILPIVREPQPLAIPVPGISRPIEVQIASTESEWEQAFRLAASSYQARGYETPGAYRLRFTPYHALADTLTLVAKHQHSVVATLSIVQDNTLLGLPMEDVYATEINALRRDRYRLFEVTTLADKELPVREFVQVFISLIQLATQYHTSHGGDAGVIAVNPRHRRFYTHVLGFNRLGPRRTYAAVQDHPAEAFWITETLMRENAPSIHDTIFGKHLPRNAMLTPKMPVGLIRRFSEQSSLCDSEEIEKILAIRERYASVRRW
jgi:hypothetical protein